MEKFKDPLGNELPSEKYMEAKMSQSIKETENSATHGQHLRKSLDAGELQTNDSDNDDDKEDENTDKTVDPPEDDDFQRPAKLDLLVGFLRLFNFVSCCTSVFAVVISIFYPVSKKEMNNDLWSFDIWSHITNMSSNDDIYTSSKEAGRLLFLEKEDLLYYMKGFAGLVQLFYLLITAVLVTIDSIATVTFRWKEYGELTHRHTDATSILFLISKSRWNLRFIMCLTVSSAASLQTTQIIINSYGQTLEKKTSEVGTKVPPHALHAVIWYLCLLSGGLLSFILGYALHLLPAR